MLRNTAEAGGGMFVEAEDPATLKDGINYILREISNRSTSFSVATVSTLQTTSGRAVIVPRFDPNKTAHWDGHLFRFDLYSEFVNACEPKGAGDLDCDGQCVSAFLADQSDSGNDKVRSLVSEAQDGNGTFVRNQAPTQALCSQAPACGTGSCTVSGNASANPFWDAGKELAAQEWKTRKVYTAVDTERRRRRRRRRRHARADDGERRQDRPLPRARHERHRAVGVRRPLQPPRRRRRSRRAPRS